MGSNVKADPQDVIVTGGAGLIGLHIVKSLLDKGHRVCILDDFANSEKEFVDPRAKIIEVDLTEQKPTVAAILEVKPKLIFHLACHPYEGLSQFNPTDVTMSTSIATLNVVTGAVRAGCVRRIVNYSSMARYGKGHPSQPKENGGTGEGLGTPFMEWYHPCPEDVYGCAKASAEKSLEILCDLHGIEWCHVVPHNVYGEANGKALSDPYRGVLLIWTNCMLRNKPFYVYGDGLQKRAPSYVGDCVEPMIKMGFNPAMAGEVVNIGAQQEYTLNDMAALAQEVFIEVTGRTPPTFVRAEKRPCEVKDAWCSIDKSVELLDYEDKTSLRDGMANLMRWAVAKFPEGLEPRYLESLEIEGDKVPSVWRDRKM